MGADTGFDAIAQTTCSENIAGLLDALEQEGKCPKTILYSLNPSDNAAIGTIMGAFQTDSPIPGGLSFIEPILRKDKAIVYRATCLRKATALDGI